MTVALWGTGRAAAHVLVVNVGALLLLYRVQIRRTGYSLPFHPTAHLPEAVELTLPSESLLRLVALMTPGG